ncbi:LysR substrate-binding domain-containing protein [Niveispirillum sp.]|uniref:LysR substrate-binding domain-containing protein n=1 Tax=Niveispirillum sp. TaxID=1917217 RepID=UPI001B684DC6|nr:LysR substrate-binding domain-containing protein [Niveispirillum sp.]MBP7339906.1 LysR family transcriptional regulator [Niveispirillum sp.]
MNLRDLRYVIAVDDHRHFGRAAEACHVSQPTLSGQIRKLEEMLGITLFERTNKSVIPTPAAEQILPLARAAVEKADAITALAQGWRDPLAGSLRLGVIPTLGPYLIPRILGPLKRDYPKLDLVLWEDITDNLLARLRRHELDAVLLATIVEDDDIPSLPLFDEPFLLVLPEGNPLAALPMIGDEDLSKVEMLVLADGHCLRDQALAACHQTGAGRADLRATSLEMLLNMVAAGYGCTLAPALVVAGRTAPVPGTVARPLAPGSAGRTVRLAFRETFPRRQAVEAVAETIRSLRLGGG